MALMNRPILIVAALFAFAAGAVRAQQAAAPEVPKHKCDNKPQAPMRAMASDTAARKKFQREIEEYKNCMKAYSDERSAAAKAHNDAGNAAINEYNETMKALQDSQR
jgi:hypothetical protein